MWSGVALEVDSSAMRLARHGDVGIADSMSDGMVETVAATLVVAF